MAWCFVKHRDNFTFTFTFTFTSVHNVPTCSVTCLLAISGESNFDPYLKSAVLQLGSCSVFYSPKTNFHTHIEVLEQTSVALQFELYFTQIF